MVVGDTAGGDGPNGTEFANQWDSDLAAELMPKWLDRGLLVGSLLDVEEVARVITTVLHTGVGASIASVVVTPRPLENS